MDELVFVSVSVCLYWLCIRVNVCERMVFAVLFCLSSRSFVPFLSLTYAFYSRKNKIKYVSSNNNNTKNKNNDINGSTHSEY